MDKRALRHALGAFATGVCVITTHDPDHVEGHVVGITANSFSSVSLDPPLIQWCLDLKAHRYDIFAKAPIFGINILSGQQEKLSRRFARENAHILPQENLVSDNNPLCLVQVAGFISCTLHETRIVGDHLIIIGRVETFETDTAKNGLSFFRGQYGQIGDVT